jgi:two-component system sensor histidine kinase YesM
MKSEVINWNRKTRKVYKKLIITNMSVLIVIVLFLEAFFVVSIQNEIRKKDSEYCEILSQNGIEYIDEIASKASIIQFSLYQNKTQLQDIIWFLSLDTEEYFNKKFDYYIQDKNLEFLGTDTYIEDALDLSPNITSISLTSYQHSAKYTYLSNGGMRHSKISMSENGLGKSVFVADGNIVFEKEIRDPDTFNSVGCLQIAFSNKGFSRLENRYGAAKIFVYHDDGTIIYESEPHRFAQNITKISDNRNIEDQYGIYFQKQQKKDLNVLTYIDKNKTGKISAFVYFMLALLGLALFLIGTYFINLRLRNLTSRLEKILNGMERAMKGDLSIRLEVGKEDELDIISENFNNMCKNLDSYIQKSFIAEIEQKNAEMSALQSQINPHFLYNTLEAIRMKAISNGDKEVGKMLYGLAVVFRSQVKDSNIINLAKEIYYCKKYLEIFEFRYQDHFRFELECPEEYLLVPVIKFIVQPIIENYFIHGIRLEDKDNCLILRVCEAEGDLIIQIKDNGRGMTQEQINQKTKELNECKEKHTPESSIGIINVHRRMAAAYGEDYGVFLEQNFPHGLCVTLKLPMREENNV